MNNIVTLDTSEEPVTTSLAIAEGVGNPHSSVIKLIRQNISDLNEFGNTGFEIQNSKSGAGRPTEYAILNEQQAALLLTYFRNNEMVRQFKKALIKAFFEMRDELNKRQFPSPSNPSRLEILQLAIQSEEERLRLENEKRDLEHQIQEDSPRVDFAKRVEIAPDAISVAQTAKIIGTGQNRLFSFLRQAGWVSQRNEPYQGKVDQGYLTVKIGNWDHPSFGLQQSLTVLVTGKGLQKLQQLWRENESKSALDESLGLRTQAKATHQ